MIPTDKTSLKLALWSSLVALLLLMSACSAAEEKTRTPQDTPAVIAHGGDTYPVDPIFTDLYATLGGMETIGPAISILLESGDLKMQYVEAGLLVYDPQAVSSERYRLAPLGVTMGISDPPVPTPDRPEVRYSNGHIIGEDFIPLYDQLGGAQYVGRPLTEVRYNLEYQRYEQYFENLGFYWSVNDPERTLQLITYGAYVCDQKCRYQPPPDSAPSTAPPIPEPFAAKVSQLGLSIVGRPLAEPQKATDGKVEMIFENMVLVVETVPRIAQIQTFEFRFWIPLLLTSEARGVRGRMFEFSLRFWLPLVLHGPDGKIITEAIEPRPPVVLLKTVESPIEAGKPVEEQTIVTVRPIAEILDIGKQAPASRGKDPLMTFYPIEDQQGFRIPILFDDFIRQHGGYELFGPPIGETIPLGKGLFRQCFANACLEFDVNQPPGNNLKLTPLGNIYKEQFFAEPGKFTEVQSADGTVMKLRKAQESVTTEESQEIVVLLAGADGPLVDRQPLLRLTLPDNTVAVYTFIPTDEMGRASLIIPPMRVSSGTQIHYEVCLLGAEEGEVEIGLCIEDSYLIFNPQ